MQSRRTLKGAMKRSFSIIGVAVAILVLITGLSIWQVDSAQMKISREQAYIEHLYQAEGAHRKWSNGLSSAISYDVAFTGTVDPTQCDFGKFLYSEETKNDSDFQDFWSEIEPLHKEVHALATTVLNQYNTDEEQAGDTYRTTVQPKIEQLISDIEQIIGAKHENMKLLEANFDAVLFRAGVACAIVIAIVFAACIQLYLRCV